MRRTTCLAYFGAVLLLSQTALGCVTTFTVPAANDADDAVVAAATVSNRVTVSSPGRDVVLARWQLPTNSPWLPYEKATLPSVLSAEPEELSLPEVEHLEQVRIARMAAERVAMAGVPARTAWFVDLRGAASVAFGQTLSRLSPVPIAVVPTFNNWPADDESVPAEETLAAMITSPPRQPEPEDGDIGPVPVFLLDSWRLAFKDEAMDDGVVDNRYMLGPADLPTASALQAQGVTGIVYLVASDEIDGEEDDLNEIFAGYEEAGIAVYFACLDTIVRQRENWEVGWWAEISSHVFVVRRRPTVVHDPRFYHRSHGGFGGAHMMPSPSGHVHLGFHGGG